MMKAVLKESLPGLNMIHVPQVLSSKSDFATNEEICNAA